MTNKYFVITMFTLIFFIYVQFNFPAKVEMGDKIKFVTQEQINTGKKKAEDSLYDQGIFRIGGLAHQISGKVLVPEMLTDKERILYMYNLQMILDAIPKNIPDRSTLTTFKIVDIKFYENYAKIEFEEDRKVEARIYKENLYRRKF